MCNLKIPTPMFFADRLIRPMYNSTHNSVEQTYIYDVALLQHVIPPA